MLTKQEFKRGHRWIQGKKKEGGGGGGGGGGGCCCAFSGPAAPASCLL